LLDKPALHSLRLPQAQVTQLLDGLLDGLLVSQLWALACVGVRIDKNGDTGVLFHEGG
jgi:hypothetical protein